MNGLCCPMQCCELILMSFQVIGPPNSLLTIIAKYDVLIRKWIGLYYALLKVSMNNFMVWWKNVRVDDVTAVLATTVSNGHLLIFMIWIAHFCWRSRVFVIFPARLHTSATSRSPWPVLSPVSQSCATDSPVPESCAGGLSTTLPGT